MAVLPLVYYPDPLLKERSKPIERFDDELRGFLDDMVETMYARNGIGLAAPQVGRLIRAAVIDIGPTNEEDLDIATEDIESPDSRSGNDFDALEQSGPQRTLYRIVNPTIVKKDGKLDYEEGCLSIPNIHGVVRRSEQLVVDAFDEYGNPFRIEANGLLAVCLQHEIDHLNGILFIDRLSTVKRELLRSRLRALAEIPREELDDPLP